jgi:hypothetical protein
MGYYPIKGNRMRRLVLAFVMLATPALAADPPPTMIMPTPFMNQVLQYMLSKPYGEVANLIAQLQACAAAQTLGDDGTYPAAAQKACPVIAELTSPQHHAPPPHPEAGK